MKLAANLSSLWTELPLLDRFKAAADAGFQGVAVPLPYELRAKDTQRACLASGLPLVQITAPPPNYTGGSRGFAAVPGLEERFRYDLRRALRYCETLRVPILHIMAGDVKGQAARDTLLSNLRHAAQSVPQGVTLTLQPQAQESAFLSDFTMAAEIITELDAPHVGLQFHTLHAQLLLGDAVSGFKQFAPLVRHVQLGDAPDGGAPGTGVINFPALYEAMEKHEYKGWVVADYAPAAATDNSLTWMPAG